MVTSRNGIHMQIYKSSRKWIAISIVLSALRGSVFPTTAYLIQRIIDGIGINKDKVFRLLFFLGFLLFLDVILFRIIDYVNIIIENGIDEDGGKWILEKCANLPYASFENADVCQKIDRILEHYKEIYCGYIRAISSFSLLTVMFIGLGMYLLSISPWIFIFLLSAVVLPLLLSIYATVKEFVSWEAFYPFYTKSKYFVDLLTNRKNVKERRMFQYVKYMEKLWEETLKKFHQGQIRSNLKPRFIAGLCVFLQYTATIVVLCVLTSQIQSNSLSLGIFVAVAQIMWSFIGDFQYQLIQTVQCVKQKALFSIQMNSFMQLPDDTAKQELEWKVAFQSLELRNVWFRYKEDSPWILRGIDLKIHCGEKTALVGENGSGKTTLIKILLGLLPQQRGEIYLNGEKIDSENRWVLTKTFGAVFQDFAHFNMTLEEYLALGNLSALRDKPKMVAVLRTLCPKENFLAEMKNGFQTVLGNEVDSGQDLSGGQWQIIAIARSLLSGKPLLILDEPTAALDPLAEANICELLYKEWNQTILISTHRLGAVSRADRIFTLAGGKIVEVGSHSSLLELKGLYAKLFNTQKAWYIHTDSVQ